MDLRPVLASNPAVLITLAFVALAVALTLLLAARSDDT